MMSDLRIEFDSVTAERNRLIRELADANARADALAAEVERLKGELENIRELFRDTHDTGCIAVIDPVAEFRALINELDDQTLSEIEARKELAALRAQLDAAGEWRPVDKPPESGYEYLYATARGVVGTATYQKRRRAKFGTWLWGDGYMLEIDDVTHWRPLPPPPQE